MGANAKGHAVDFFGGHRSDDVRSIAPQAQWQHVFVFLLRGQLRDIHHGLQGQFTVVDDHQNFPFFN
ncbi:MAG: hypothetical protein ACRERU_07565 [Methylococcales bacterium]